MTELKTLKDFEPKDTDCVSRKEIKQEAIKWVKFYQKGEEDTEEDRQWLRMWIVKFFTFTIKECAKDEDI